MGLTHCYKTAVFLTFIFAVFQSQSIAETQLLPQLEKNGRHMEIRFRFWTFYRHWHVILHRRKKLSELGHHWESYRMMLCRFSKMAVMWRPYRHKSTFAFWFYNVSLFGRQRTICVPNFDQISQSTAVILLLPVPENKRPPYLNSTPGFDFDLFAVISMWFCTGLQSLMQIGWSPTELWRHTSYWFSKMAVAYLLPVSDLATSNI